MHGCGLSAGGPLVDLCGTLAVQASTVYEWTRQVSQDRSTCGVVLRQGQERASAAAVDDDRGMMGKGGACRASAAADAEATAERDCEEICWQLVESAVLADEEWEQKMEAVLERVRAVDDAVFGVMVGNQWFRRRLVHAAALYGSRAVLEEGCVRTPGGPAKAAQAFDSDGNMLLHLAVRNKRLAVEDIVWLLSLHSMVAATPNGKDSLPLHLLVWNHAALTPELVDVVLGAHPQALHIANQARYLPLHSACSNPSMTAPALRRLVSLDTEAAGTAHWQGWLPLHVLVYTHGSLTPELVDIVVDAHPQALQTAEPQGNLPLHFACDNLHASAPTLCHLISLHAAAAGAANRYGVLPLHQLVRKRTSLAPALVVAFVEAHPQSLQKASRHGDLPLHYACLNPHMNAQAFQAILRPFPEAASIPNSAERLPYHNLSNTSDTTRCLLAQMLMEATDSLFPYETPCSDARTSLSSLSGPRYVPSSPDPRWASREHPLSRQGRLKAGLRAAVRGRENVWQFQTGGGPQPGRAVVDDTSLVNLVRAGHRSLVRQRLAHLSAAVNVPGVVEAVLPALELGHVNVVRELLAGEPSAVNISCSPTQACEWLGALMRLPQQDYGWLMEWLQCGTWSTVNRDRLCLEAAAVSGNLALVESMAMAWQARHGSGSVPATAADGAREELGLRAVAGGSVAVLRWLQDAGLATCPTQPVALFAMGAALVRHDRLEMVDLLHRERQWVPADTAVRVAVESGSIRVLRWLHVHTSVRMAAGDMAAAIRHGHAAVVQFLHRHRNITRVRRDDVLAEAVRHSAPGTLHVLEYVLRHHLCGGGDDEVATREVVVNACTATTVRLEVVRYLVSRASEGVLRSAEAELSRLGERQAQDVFREAQLRLHERLP